MKTRLTLLFVAAIAALTMTARADETITVTANNTDISASLDLKAVATLFGESENLEIFEQKLNSEEQHISNLDLNGDGEVDYIRVVEQAEGQTHLILLQAILAKDIFQDVASIYVEKDAAGQITTQVIGDEYIYGTNYVIEPVYIYTPAIYDWFWSPYWSCYYSPWYWDYWPNYWHHYYCWGFHDYWHHIYGFHHHHHYCSFRHPYEPVHGYYAIYNNAGSVRRNDMAVRHPENNFASRNAGRVSSQTGRAAVNARDLQPSRSSVAAGRNVAGAGSVSGRGQASASRATSASSDRTFGSGNIRVASSAARTSTSAPSRSAATTSRGATSASASRASATTGARTTTATASRPSGATTATATRSSATTTATRSTATTTATRSTASTPSRSTTPARSSSYSGSSSPSRSSGSFGGSSSHSSGSYGGGGGYSGGGSRGGGASSSGASRSGGGTTRR